MPEYVLNRNHTLAANGHMISFVKGQPTWVPPDVEMEATKIGAEPVEGPKLDVLGPETTPPPDEPEGADRTALLHAAFDQITDEAERDSFSAQGIPTAKAVQRVVGFAVSKKEIDTEYRAYKQAKTE